LDLQSLAETGSGGGVEVDNNILERLESLEKMVMETNVSTLKQQLDIIKPAVVSVKNISASTTKEVKELKALVEELKAELANTQLQLDNFIESQNLLLEETDDNDNVETPLLECDNILPDNDEEIQNDLNDLNDITGANLKEIIEQELIDA
jgi:hypothetical protein